MSQLVTVYELRAVAQSYLAYVKRKKAENTYISYESAIRRFLDYLESRGVGEFAGVTRVLMEEWQTCLATEPRPHTNRPLALGSQALHASAVRSLFQWAAKMELCDAKLSLWFDKISVPEPEPRPLNKAAMLRIRVYFLEESTDPRYLLERALFFYLVGTAARIAEGIQVPRDGFERVTVRQKGGRPKLMLCPRFAAEMVRAYLAIRIDAHPALFVRRAGREDVVLLSAAAARLAWRRIAKRLGVERFTTHQLRHTAASAMLAKGVAEGAVTNLMGHKNLATLRIYGAVPESQRQHTALVMDDYLEAG